MLQVSLFFTESPTNPFLICVDIKLVSKLCHAHGAVVCIDGTFATPLNQKALALGSDIVLHSATKYIGGHNDVCFEYLANILLVITILVKWNSVELLAFIFQVLAGCVSGSMEIVSPIRNLHHVLGGALNPVSILYAVLSTISCRFLLIWCWFNHLFSCQNAAYLIIHENYEATCTAAEFHCAKDGQSFKGTS